MEEVYILVLAVEVKNVEKLLMFDFILQGLSLVLFRRKEKTLLVAFGGNGAELSNQVRTILFFYIPLLALALLKCTLDCSL